MTCPLALKSFPRIHQAGIRAMGSLSVVDYPGYETAEAPDMETYSKALNGGQYPLSVLALQVRARFFNMKDQHFNSKANVHIVIMHLPNMRGLSIRDM